jgi:hypothetical protein
MYFIKKKGQNIYKVKGQRGDAQLGKDPIITRAVSGSTGFRKFRKKYNFNFH